MSQETTETGMKKMTDDILDTENMEDERIHLKIEDQEDHIPEAETIEMQDPNLEVGTLLPEDQEVDILLEKKT